MGGDPEVRQRNDEIVGVFDASYDLVYTDRDLNSLYDKDEALQWEREQAERFAKAIADLQKFYLPTFIDHTLLNIMDLVDALSSLWCEHSNAVEDGNQAEMNIMEQLR